MPLRLILFALAPIALAVSGGGCAQILGVPSDYTLCGPSGAGGCGGAGGSGSDGGPDAQE